MIAPNVTAGEWITQKDNGSLDRDDWCIGVDGAIDCVAVCYGRDAKMLAASKNLAEALHVIIDGGLLECYDSPERRDKGNCAYCQAKAALLLAGYTDPSPTNKE